jgi:ferredoxin-NADP reductase
MKSEILAIEKLTFDVKRFTLSKPKDYTFQAGQATEVAIDKPGWDNQLRPFTFSSKPDEEHLQLIIKIYHDHEGATHQIDRLEVGDQFLIKSPWGAIKYKGPGVFLAGGAGITPFLPIIRQLHESDDIDGHKLIFSNKTERDIILRNTLNNWMSGRCLHVLTETNGRVGESDSDLLHLGGYIDQDFLADQIDDIDQHFYICGPQPFNASMKAGLQDLGANPETLVFEQ